MVAAPVRFGKLTVDLATGRVQGGAPVVGKELALLRYFAAQAGCVVSRDELLHEVWDYHPSVLTRVVDLTISRLRRRLEPDPINPAFLKTVHGEGYVLVGAPVAVGAPEPRPDEGLFVGRQRELSFVSTWAARGDGRWLTIVGPPGIGKSRLAREIRHVWTGSGPETDSRRCAFVPLDSARSVTDLVSRVCRVLDLRLNSLGDPLAWLARSLGDRPLLLFLDDVDPAREAVLALHQALLSSAPGTRVLATGRRPLGFAGEPLMRLGPLTDVDASALLSSLGGGTPELAGATAGNPLAIALAAASLRAGVAPASCPRGLDDAIESSWSRLPAEIGSQLARLATFAGSFDEDAAVGAVEASTEGLDRLVEESLLDAVDGRYGLHPAIRDFARRQLEASGAAERWRDQHAAWHLDQLALSLPALRGAARRGALRAQLARLDDLDRAWMRAVEGGDAARVLRAAEAMEELVRRTGLWLSGHRCFGAALERGIAHEDIAQRVPLLTAHATCLGRLGEGVIAWSRLGEVLEGAHELSKTTWSRVLRARVEAGVAVVADGEVLATAMELTRLAADLEDERERLLALLCALQFRTGASLQLPHRAETRRAVELAARLQEGSLEGEALMLHGICAWRGGDADQAQRDLERARALLDEVADSAIYPLVLGYEAGAMADLGRGSEAVALIARIEGIFERQGANLRTWGWRRNRAILLVRLGRFDEAEALLERTLAASRADGHARLEMSTLETLVSHRVASGRWQEALALGEIARATSARHRMTPAPEMAEQLALACLCLQDPRGALAQADEGLALCATLDNAQPAEAQTLHALHVLAALSLRQEQEPWPELRQLLWASSWAPARALALWGTASRLLHRAPRAAALCLGHARARGLRPPLGSLVDAAVDALESPLGAAELGAALRDGERPHSTRWWRGWTPWWGSPHPGSVRRSGSPPSLWPVKSRPRSRHPLPGCSPTPAIPVRRHGHDPARMRTRARFFLYHGEDL